MALNKTEKKEFVYDLISHIQADIIKKIDLDLIPEGWNGIELRQYIADRFAEQMTHKMSRKQKKDYRNIVAVKNL